MTHDGTGSDVTLRRILPRTNKVLTFLVTCLLLLVNQSNNVSCDVILPISFPRQPPIPVSELVPPREEVLKRTLHAYALPTAPRVSKSENEEIGHYSEIAITGTDELLEPEPERETEREPEPVPHAEEVARPEVTLHDVTTIEEEENLVPAWSKSSAYDHASNEDGSGHVGVIEHVTDLSPTLPPRPQTPPPFTLSTYPFYSSTPWISTTPEPLEPLENLTTPAIMVDDLNSNQSNWILEEKGGEEMALNESEVRDQTEYAIPHREMDPEIAGPDILARHPPLEHHEIPGETIDYATTTSFPVTTSSSVTDYVTVAPKAPPTNNSSNMSSEQVSLKSISNNNYELGAGAITGIVLGAISSLVLVLGVMGFLIFRQKHWRNNPTSYDNKLSRDNCAYLDDSFRCSYFNNHVELPKDNCEEMLSLDNDSFLNSLEAMTLENYWTEANRSTKV